MSTPTNNLPVKVRRADAVPEWMAIDVRDLQCFTAEQLRAEIADCMTVTVSRLVRIAACVRILEDRGEDLSDLRLGIFQHIRRMAYGQVLPELVVNYQSSPALLRKITMLPIPDQQRILDNRPVPVAVLDKGDNTHVLIAPKNLSKEQIRQVFDNDHIRDLPEQFAYLRSNTVKPPPQPVPSAYHVDKRRNGLVVEGAAFISAAELHRLLGELMR
jgi:hypothetical protein